MCDRFIKILNIEEVRVILCLPKRIIQISSNSIIKACCNSLVAMTNRAVVHLLSSIQIFRV